MDNAVVFVTEGGRGLHKSRRGKKGRVKEKETKKLNEEGSTWQKPRVVRGNRKGSV